MKPIYEYVTCNTPVDFYTVTESAARKGHIAIGYKTRENGELKIITNPAKSEPITFNENDSLIVVAEDWKSLTHLNLNNPIKNYLLRTLF